MKRGAGGQVQVADGDDLGAYTTFARFSESPFPYFQAKKCIVVKRSFPGGLCYLAVIRRDAIRLIFGNN